MRQAEEGNVYITGHGPDPRGRQLCLPDGACGSGGTATGVLPFEGAAATERMLRQAANNMIRSGGAGTEWRGWRWVAEVCLRSAGFNGGGAFVEICEVRYNAAARCAGSPTRRIPDRFAVIDRRREHVWYSTHGPEAAAKALADDGFFAGPARHPPPGRTRHMSLTFLDLETGACAHILHPLHPAEPECRLWPWVKPQAAHAWLSPHEVVGGPVATPGRFADRDHILVAECCSHCGVYRVHLTNRRQPGRQGTSLAYRDADRASRAWVERRLQERGPVPKRMAGLHVVPIVRACAGHRTSMRSARPRSAPPVTRMPEIVR